MGLQITSFSELDTARVDELLALFSTWMQEKHPEVELSRGAFHDLVLYFNSVLNASLQENVSRVMQSNSLLAITQNPALADTALVDNVLSNFNITREAGVPAVGEAMVIVGQNVATQISANTRFTANGVSFYPTATFIGAPANTAVSASANTRQLVVGPNGTYAFKIPVIANFVGSVGNIAKGTTLVPDAVPSNVLAIFAASDFVKGSDPPTNSEYIAKLATGLAAKTIGGRKSFSALIRGQEAFKVVRHLSIVGFGDAEQLRDQRGIFPISGGGRVDIYAQTHDTAQYIDHLVTAKFVGPADPALLTSGTIWEITVDRNLYPGFYSVTKVSQVPTSTAAIANPSVYNIIQRTPGMFFNPGEYQPDIQTVFESAFTRFRQETIRFIDTDRYLSPDLSPAAESPYLITTVGMPLIGELQDFLSDADVRCRTADVLVRAAVPCFTTIGFTVRVSPADADIGLTGVKDKMKNAIVTAISKLGFAGELSVSTITNAVAPYLSGQQSVHSMDIFGRIFRPDGQVVFVRDQERIVIPTDPANLVSPKTTVFLTSAADITINTEVAASFGD